MRIWLLVGLFVAVVSADGPSELGLAKARIEQLEVQLQQVDAMRAAALANLVVCQESQQRATIEQEAGCAIDWQAVPPKCKE